MNPRRELQLLACAVQLLTRLPTPRLDGFEPDWPTRAARYYPLAGQIVGLACALAWLLASHLWTGLVPALVAVAVGVAITGGFHEDGLADTFDSLGGHTAEGRLAIMKDSRVGSYGVLALGLVTALKTAALATLAPRAGALALFAAHGVGRSAAVVLMAALPYTRDAQTAKLPVARRAVGWSAAALALLLGCWPLALLGLPAAVLAGLICALAILAVGRKALRAVGGYTGDILGAVEQLAETTVLLGAAAVLHR